MAGIPATAGTYAWTMQGHRLQRPASRPAVHHHHPALNAARQPPGDRKYGAGRLLPAGRGAIGRASGRCRWRTARSARCQYPYPWEVADGLDAGPAEPDTVTSCQTPPETFSPLPLACPGAVSPA
jgi:hypothetical protein